MKAFMIHEPHKHSVVDIPVSEPGEGQVLVRSMYAGICGTDLELAKGMVRADAVSYPCIPGHEWSGIVEKVGPGVTGLKQGDRVVSEGVQHCGHCRFCRQGETNLCENMKELGFTIPGGLSEYVVVNARMVHRLPDNFPLDMAALIEPTAVVTRGVWRAHPEPGETVAVIGPGTVGLLAVMIAKLFSPRRIILIGVTDESLSLGISLGATDIVNITREEAAERVSELTDGYGADIVIECAGKSSAVDMALSIVRRGGKVVLLGAAGKDAKMELFSDIFHVKDLEIHGILSYTKKTWQDAVNLVTNRLIPVDKLIRYRFSLDEVDKALDVLDSGKSVGKSLIELT
ncbi:zinc-dependent alcohol dehydrogenase [Paenibacillus spongiae]|uniref:Alcohol dehydrogenase catalytic domain-containing protein n=1 Tax=Paenibacillus spongiae TaxID=2909671 RepID=A0ABY5S244_9BACL|nr:alcohol dehydrogenase catalytic domain-containing protein [Paenibacillus spongiae]UVI27936.1 alcohol dehydrogenase catalytic domain-containing protein [Paenibacillus spongiae]